MVGRSTLVGLPALLLLGRKGVDATVTLAHSRTADLAAVCREADIIIAAAGQARMITAEHVKPGCRGGRRRRVARQRRASSATSTSTPCSRSPAAITPMPGGTGPMTIACLLENTLAGAKMLGAV